MGLDLQRRFSRPKVDLIGQTSKQVFVSIFSEDFPRPKAKTCPGAAIDMRLHDFAQARSTSEAIIIEQALALLFGLDDAPLLNDYLFSIAAMREDWDEMPDDWIADEAKDAISSR